MPSLAALRAFDAVAQCKSYADASRVLNVTEAAMRQHTRKLEQFFGCSLVERKGRGLTLTEDGRRLSAATAESFQILMRGVEDIKATNEQQAVKVALAPSFAENWLIPRLASFWIDHPDIEVELAPSLKVTDLRAGRFDFAIRYGHGDWPDGEAFHLASAEYVVVARPDTPGIQGILDKPDLANIRSLPWLFESTRTEHRNWAEERGIDFDAAKNRHFPTNSLVISAARAGQGLTLQARALIENDLLTGTLVEIVSEEPGSLGYYIVTNGSLRPAARLFVNWLIK